MTILEFVQTMTALACIGMILKVSDWLKQYLKSLP